MAVLRVLLLAGSVMLLLQGLLQAEASTIYQRPTTCYSSELDRVVPLGYTWQVDGCQAATCDWDGGLTRQACASQGIRVGCTLERNLSKPFPECCGSEVCPEFIEGCYAEELGRYVPDGYTWTVEGCLEMICSADSIYKYAHRACGLIGRPNDCNVERDMSKPFPECCCPEGPEGTEGGGEVPPDNI